MSEEGKRKLTSITELLAELNGGTVEQILNIALSDAAANVIEHGREGSVTLKIKMKRIGDGNQVNAVAKVDYKVPTHRGAKAEDYAVATPLFVGRGGRLTVLPDNQLDIFNRKTASEMEREEIDRKAG